MRYALAVLVALLVVSACADRHRTYGVFHLITVEARLDSDTELGEKGAAKYLFADHDDPKASASPLPIPTPTATPPTLLDLPVLTGATP